MAVVNWLQYFFQLKHCSRHQNLFVFSYNLLWWLNLNNLCTHNNTSYNNLTHVHVNAKLIQTCLHVIVYTQCLNCLPEQLIWTAWRVNKSNCFFLRVSGIIFPWLLIATFTLPPNMANVYCLISKMVMI